MLLPGTIIRKIYKGNLLEVKVLETGFEYNDKIYKSLSKLAKEITVCIAAVSRFLNYHAFSVRHESAYLLVAESATEKV